MPSIRVGIVGATGYTAREAARLIAAHPSATVTVATSRSETGTALAAIHPSLTGHCDITIDSFDPDDLARRCDVAMCCLPHGASAKTVRELVDAGLRVIDFSADFRLSSVELYQRWYGVTHPWPEMIGQVPYGLPEMFADAIRDSVVVANPGCYPTSAILPLAPLVAAGQIDPGDIIVDSKSGVSGAGRSVKLATLFCETNESIAAYAIGSHRHGPEISDLIERIAGQSVETVFTPHLVPMDRGILSTIYVRPRCERVEDIIETWRATFAHSPFVHVVDRPPSTKHVAGTNHVHLSAHAAGTRVVIVAAIDNLSKGASGAAVQNLNVMFGLGQATGL